jgi:hypothetical protein
MTPPKERNIPASTSALAGAPKLTPKVNPLKVGDQAGADGGPEAAGELPRKPRPAVRPGRSRGGRRPPPAVADAIPTTVRFDIEEALEVDRFVMDLRDAAYRRTLDKAEVIRELLRLAREDDTVRRRLLRRLL